MFYIVSFFILFCLFLFLLIVGVVDVNTEISLAAIIILLMSIFPLSFSFSQTDTDESYLCQPDLVKYWKNEKGEILVLAEYEDSLYTKRINRVGIVNSFNPKNIKVVKTFNYWHKEIDSFYIIYSTQEKQL